MKELTEEELEEKQKLIDSIDFDYKDYIAMFFAAVITFLPPVLIIFLLIWLLIKFFTR